MDDADAILEAERNIAEEPGFFCSKPSELTVENVINTISNRSQMRTYDRPHTVHGEIDQDHYALAMLQKPHIA